jgi:endonuclease/exonuclease/phosphatase family metal-dependent hydrolase
MQLDVLAIEEIKRPPRGEQGLSELRSKLDGLTGGSWQAALDDCPRASSQHVGLLWNAKRATLRSKSVVGELNPLGGPCERQLRPGLAGYFGFPGGLDLSVIAAHLKSGADEHALQTRAHSFEAISAAIAGQGKRTNDHDVLVLGDMNTMGCEECAPVVSSAAELTRVDALLAAAQVPVARVAATPGCSHRYEHRSALLDWAARSDLAELPAGRSAVVSGVCAELGCDDLGEHLAAQRHLSDHCPIWLDLDDQDRD